MKRILLLVLMAMLVLCGCSNNKKSVENSATGSDVNSQEEYSMQVTENDTQSEENSTSGSDTSSQEEYDEKIAKKVMKSDGVLEKMSIGELTKKLSKLNKKTTMTDLIDIFGKAPHMVIEADSNLYNYFCGDVQICLWGVDLYGGGSLFQVIVDNNDSSSSNDSGFSIDLPKEKAE